MVAKDKLVRTAIVYDFDGTLAHGNIQEHSFIPEIGLEPKQFWDEVRAAAQQHDGDEILIYMWRMLAHAAKHQRAITENFLRAHGQSTPLFEGLTDWFARINAYAVERGLELDHYVVSSGLYEMISGCSIFAHFKKVFASRFLYDDTGCAVWPAVAINYTTKTQFLFRINKGIDTTWDNGRINRWQQLDERPVPFSRMIFIGDGETDIPSMKMVRQMEGHSIAVFDPDKARSKKSQENIYQLIAEDRVHFVAPADYRDGSQLDSTVKGILGRLARECGYRDAEP